jgi:hypothetical protein
MFPSVGSLEASEWKFMARTSVGHSSVLGVVLTAIAAAVCGHGVGAIGAEERANIILILMLLRASVSNRATSRVELACFFR